MGSQQLCLKWNNHHSNMQTMFEDLLSNETFVDVTLACDGSTLKAHKVVLSACSPFFQNIFIENPCKHPVIILKDMRFPQLKAIVNFMYRGEVNISQDQLSDLLKTAEALKIKGLAEITGDTRSSVFQSQQHNSDSTGSYEVNSTPPSPPPTSRRKRTRPQKQLLTESGDSEEFFEVKSRYNDMNDSEPLSLVPVPKDSSSLLNHQSPFKNNTTSMSSEELNKSDKQTEQDGMSSNLMDTYEESIEDPDEVDEAELNNGTESPTNLTLDKPNLLAIKDYDSRVNSPSALSYDNLPAGPSNYLVSDPSGLEDTSGPFLPLLKQPSYNLHATLDRVLKRKEFCMPLAITSDPGTSLTDKPVCPICKKSYSSKSNLQRHMEMHFGQRKKYSCHVCKKYFTWKTNLTTHIKTIHKPASMS